MTGTLADYSLGDVKGADRARVLMVIEGAGVRTFPLSVGTELGIGRSPLNEICIDDPKTSRDHGRLGLDESGLWIKDLGSANGTTLGDTRMAPGSRMSLVPGQTVEIGGALLVVPRGAVPRHRLRPSAYGHFLNRLDDECSGLKSGGRPLAVLRVRMVGDAAPDQVQSAITEGLRTTDIVAHYAPGELHLLLPSTAPERAEQTADAIYERLEALGLDVLVAVARAPEHGGDADSLLQHAGAELNPRLPADLPSDVVLESPAVLDQLKVLRRVARGDIPVLLLGETGVGKEVFASLVHQLSPRAEKPFQAINCAAVNPALAESQLFGHRKGAFTGADADRAGLLESASGGTLFLDELGEMPAELQAKLLRALQEKRIRRVGDDRERAIDVRLVSATNRDLQEEVESGRFRQDLMYRVNGVVVNIPPLRERKEEIPVLARMFVRRHADGYGEDVPELSPAALEVLVGYEWPGNIRELVGEMERAVLMQERGRIEPEHLNLDKLKASWSPARRAAAVADSAPGLADMSGDDERTRIARALEQCGGNQTKAAAMLGISRRTLTNRLGQYGFPRPRKS